MVYKMTCHSEERSDEESLLRPQGVTLAPGASAGENPRHIEPQSSMCRETLRYAQSDMLESISSNLDTPHHDMDLTHHSFQYPPPRKGQQIVIARHGQAQRRQPGDNATQGLRVARHPFEIG